VIQLFLADDHTLFREGIKQILSNYKDISVTGEADNGEETLKNIRRHGYDVILLDNALPDMDSLEILKQIKNMRPNSRILILSLYSEGKNAIQAFKAGACGYLSMRESIAELISAIRRVATGEKYVSRAIAEALVSHLDELPYQPKHQQLSKREYQVMLRIAAGKSIKEIGRELDLKSSTVSTLRRRMLRKMEMKNNADITRYVIEEHLLNL